MSAAAVISALANNEGPIEVVGSGALADNVRRLLAERVRRTLPDIRPATIIETTGEADALLAALERVEDLGTVVLAGPVPNRPLAVDLYADLHVRGLVLLGVPPETI